MTQTPVDPTAPRGKRPRLEVQAPQVPLQQTAVYPPPVPAGPSKVKRWPAAFGAGVLGLFVGVGLGASSPRAADAPSTVQYVTRTVQAPASTVTVIAPAPAAEAAAPAAENAVPAVEAPASPGGPLTSFSDGTYEVGTGDGQVAAGKYRSAGGTLCYWSRLKNNDGALGDIIDNNVGEGQMILNVAKSDGYVEIRGCTFTKAS